jgi:hypothetical protein
MIELIKGIILKKEPIGVETFLDHTHWTKFQAGGKSVQAATVEIEVGNLNNRLPQYRVLVHRSWRQRMRRGGWMRHENPFYSPNFICPYQLLVRLGMISAFLHEEPAGVAVRTRYRTRCG